MSDSQEPPVLTDQEKETLARMRAQVAEAKKRPRGPRPTGIQAEKFHGPIGADNDGVIHTDASE